MPLRSHIRRTVRALGYGSTEPRPRAIWRIILPLVAVFLPVVVALSAVVDRLSMETLLLVQSVLFAVLTVGVLVGTARWLDRRPVAAYGFDLGRRWGVEFAAGVGLALVIHGLVLAVALGLGWATIDGWASPGATFGFATGTGVALVSFALVGFWEEAVFRGILLTNAAEGLAARGAAAGTAVLGAVVVSTVLFAGLHLNQVPDAGALLLSLATWLLMGGLLAVGYVATRSLALPIGLHFGTDFAANNLFGLSGDAGTAFATVLRLDVAAPDALLAVEGALVASLPHLGAILLGYLLLAVWLAAGDGLAVDPAIAEWRPRSTGATTEPE